ncbi:protein-L-isoaspartate O-methyltransferase family protein [Pseudohoeflea coraliihabitans]|uniref:Protein-L-isoaspartate O-methyltransferase n=1 Tax=Pseudohoeflea coraliihabitans TaxID=2860393 RepID=A0ABS6WQQ8_9HYPH|nr:protein-L-isoaspartate O-methyltransferase [Pseudohoeflea sp. DP4N28-3]MBW3098105.1 protein-L-isoaspartate O-methyltransferase [Pseudohoeflea sp. DP4N28-3]
MAQEFESARQKMVDNQIRTTDVTSHSVLQAFLSVEREKFVPANKAALAYIDSDIEVVAADEGRPARYLMEPSPLAKLLQLAAIDKNDVVLEIGGCCGYTAALLSLLAGSVVTLESDEALAQQATETLSANGYDNVAVVTGPLREGYASEAPFDVIFINGAIDEVPEELTSQLREGGRLVTVIGRGGAAQAHLLLRSGETLSGRPVFNAAVPILPGFEREAAFVF